MPAKKSLHPGRTVDRPKNILVVDDDGDVRDIIIDMLLDRGYATTAAKDGASARERIEREEGLAAVVLDAEMPGEPSAAIALYCRDRRLPVVMISGSPEAMEFAQAHDLQLLWKPFRGDELCAALERAIASGVFGQRDGSDAD